MTYKRLEASIEDSVVRWARAQGCEHRKMNGMGYRAWEDQMFLIPARISATGRSAVVWIEFKREGEVPTPLQAEHHKWMHEAGFTSVWFDNRDAAIAYLRRFLK